MKREFESEEKSNVVVSDLDDGRSRASVLKGVYLNMSISSSQCSASFNDSALAQLILSRLHSADSPKTA